MLYLSHCHNHAFYLIFFTYLVNFVNVVYHLMMFDHIEVVGRLLWEIVGRVYGGCGDVKRLWIVSRL